MKYARPCEHCAEGGSQKDPTGGHMNTSQVRDVEGQDEDGELSRREKHKIKGKEE